MLCPSVRERSCCPRFVQAARCVRDVLLQHTVLSCCCRTQRILRQASGQRRTMHHTRMPQCFSAVKHKLFNTWWRNEKKKIVYCGRLYCAGQVPRYLLQARSPWCLPGSCMLFKRKARLAILFQTRWKEKTSKKLGAWLFKY